MWYSTYGNTYFGVAALGAAFVSFMFFLVSLLLVCIVARRSTNGDISTCGWLTMCFVGLLLLAGQILWVLSGAAISGVGFAPAGGMFAAACLPWLFVIPLIVAALSPKIWRGHPSLNPCRVACFSLASSLRAVAVKPALVWSLLVAAMTGSAMAFLGLQGLCYCSNPTQVSSWASRRVSAPICTPDTICHAYTLLGETPDKMHVVVQFVSPTSTNDRVLLTLCETDYDALAIQANGPRGSAAANCTSTSTLRSFSTPVSFTDYAYLSEDPRFVAHFHLTGLTPSRAHKLTVQLLSGGSSSSQVKHTREVLFKTVTGLTDTTTPVKFIGGGDYYMGETGLETLMAALQATPDAEFIFLGGDLSYANNMRTCYRRWDQFFVEVSSRVNAHGYQLPIVVIPGNHEAGGYVQQKSPYTENSYDEKFYFYREYFPHMDSRVVSPTSNVAYYHSHAIGAYLGLAMLDSGCFVKTTDQVSFLDTLLQDWMTTANASANTSKFVIPMFHVPAFAGAVARSSTSDSLARSGVKDDFVPLFEKHKVAVAFQYHEHVYFRSKPIDTTGAAQSSASSGIVYLGDGAMGVAGSSRKARPSNSGYVDVAIGDLQFSYSCTFYPGNRSLHVSALSPKDQESPSLGNIFDYIDIAPRV